MDAKGLSGVIQADDTTVRVSANVMVAGTLSANMIIGDGSNIRNVAQYKKGQGTFTAGTTQTVIVDTFCTSETLVYLNIMSNPAKPLGVWQVDSTDGQITIQSDCTELGSVPFEYFLVKSN